MASFDRVFDAFFSEVGINPTEIENFLSSRKNGTRMAANTISVTRVFLGYLVIAAYESAQRKKDKKGMVVAILLLIAVLTSDSIDGYLCRKAHIENSKLGKVVDSACDVALRIIIARSSILSQRDWILYIRGMAELGVGAYVIPDIIEGTYSSSDSGKAKVVADSVAVISAMLTDVVPYQIVQKPLRFVNYRARFIGAILASLDAILRRIKKKKKTKNILGS